MHIKIDFTVCIEVVLFGSVALRATEKKENKIRNLIEFILCVRARPICLVPVIQTTKGRKMFILYIVLIVLCLYLLWARRHIYILSWKMPGPPVYIPIVGNILSMWNEEGLSMIKSNFYIVLCSLTYGLTYAMAMDRVI